MKNLIIRFSFYTKVFSLLLIAFMANTTVQAHSLSGLPESYKLQQTKQTRKSKKIKKRVVKKVINKPKSTIVAKGIWGGTGIGFDAGENGVQVEFDCAQGEINQKFLTDENGNFNLNGFYTYETPVRRIDFTPKPQAASFQGRISGSTMNLKVVLTESKQLIGEYTLTRDAMPGIRKCR